MLEDVLRTACQLDPARPVLAGISGGPDSLCLLDVLHATGYRVIVAHFNHRLRPEADLEAASVSGHARTLNLPFLTEAGDVRKFARLEGMSIEEAARTLRYRFLFAAARREGAQAVAVGHTADDQVETVLMHFLRGAGLAGLKGMEYRSFLPVFDAEIPLVRPLLSLWRADTERYCREHNLQPHFDASNADETYFRNRLRHTLIPELEKYNPRFKEALVRTANTLQGDYALLQGGVDAAWQEVFADSREDWVAFDEVRLRACPRAVRWALFRRAGETLRPESRDIGFEALERAAAFVDNPASRQVDFVNGLYLFAENGRIYLAAYEADLPFAQWPQVQVEQLPVRWGRLDLGNGWVLLAKSMLFLKKVQPFLEELQQQNDKWTAWLDADKTAGWPVLSTVEALTVRGRRRGDRFQPLGMEEGSVKLSDFFINVKLPRRARDKWPLVCAGKHIVWIPGYRIAHPFRVTEKTRRVLKVALRKL